MSLQFNLVRRGETANITVVVDGELYVADEAHPRFDEIVEAAIDGDESVIDLFDISNAVAKRFEELSERVSVANSRVYVDGDEVDDVYADQIVRFLEDDLSDWEPLVNFLEKVYTNNEPHTRENLSRWLKSTGGFTIDSDGDIVGYKGVRADMGSVHAGPAVVNGESVDGHVPNHPGSVVTMARSKVEHNPAVGCAAGLHVGTWEYASSFGSVVLEVKVNPRDVVSVPTDCNGQKMRVSRYKVVRILDSKHNEASIQSDWVAAEDYDEYDDEDWSY